MNILDGWCCQMKLEIDGDNNNNNNNNNKNNTAEDNRVEQNIRETEPETVPNLLI